MDVEILGDFLDGLDALERLKCPAGCAFGFVSSSLGFYFVWLRLGSSPAPDHHHQSRTPRPNFGVRLSVRGNKLANATTTAGITNNPLNQNHEKLSRPFAQSSSG